MKPATLILALLAASSARVRAADVPARAAAAISDNAFGVDLSGWEDGAATSTSAAALVDAYSQAGVKWARVRASWPRVETSTGVYRDEDVDALVRLLDARGVNVLLTLDGAGQTLYADGAAPTAADGALAPWLAWATHTAARYQGKVAAWQVWDEPDRTWSPAPSAADYSALLRATSDAIRAVRPGAVVVSGAVSGADAKFLSVVAASAAGSFDAAVLRLPTGADARTRERTLASARSVLFAAALPAPALWVGPDLAPVDDGSGAGADSPAIRAKRLARDEVAALAGGAARSFAAPELGDDGAPLPQVLNVLRTLSALFADGAAPSATLRATFTGAPRELVCAAFMTGTDAPLPAFWTGGPLSEDDPGPPAVLTLSEPVLDPVLVDPLDGSTAPLGSGTLTTVSVPVRDYPRFVTAASVLTAAASELLVAGETFAVPNPVRGGEVASFHFSLTAAATVRIEITTEDGELLRAASVDAPAGRTVWNWVADVAAGTYDWRVSARGRSLANKIVVVRSAKE